MNRVLSPRCVEASLLTISSAIGLQATLHPDRPAVVCAGLPPLSFGELVNTIERIGDDLHAAGMGAATRVGVLLPNGPEAAVIAVAVAAHAICYPLDPALSAAGLESEADRVGIEAIVVPDWVEMPASRAARSLEILHASRDARSLGNVRLMSKTGRIERPVAGVSSAQSVAIIQTSSGSTGMPKHVLVTHANVLDVARKLQAWFGLSGADRSACILPVHSGIGFKVTLLAPLLIGSGVIIAAKQRADDIAEWSTDHDPTWFFAAPAYLNAVLDSLRASGRGPPNRSLRFVLTGGTFCPERLRVDLEAALGIPLLEQYGSRESGPITASPAPPAVRKPGTVGPVSANIAVFDDSGAALPSGAAGVVAVRGQGISPGYIEALPAGCDVVPAGRSPDRWLPTGDIGIVDEDGFLTIVGRAKQIINRGGEKIAPSEVESALLRHPDVREAAVFGVLHPRLGEGVEAAIVAQPGTELTSAELQDFLFGRLAPHKIPQSIHVVAALPRNAGGKVQVSQLVEQVSCGEHRPVPASGNLEALIVAIWQRLLGRADVGVDDNFFELGGDSLLATTMLLEVEELVRQQIPPSALRAVWTIRQLIFVLLRDTPPPEQPVTCVRGGSGTPFFFCHGDRRDRGIYALRLMDLIEHDAPVYLLNHHRDFLDSGGDSLEDIVPLYISCLLAAQPAGPFRIGGYCLGGIVALEIARQLKAAGRSVEFIVVVDSPSLNARAGLRAIKTLLVAASRILPRGVRASAVSNGMWATWVAVRSRPVIWGAIKKLARYVAVRRSAGFGAGPTRWNEYRWLSSYVPEASNTPLHCLVCAENATRFDFKPSNWRRIMPSGCAAVVPGDHHSCVTRFANVVAAELQNIVRAA
jgi:acyl-CoA synthetase (AMP-forming)/AMP-acid ligase II/thioesterase domain-containing protein/acyl carrier protein